MTNRMMRRRRVGLRDEKEEMAADVDEGTAGKNVKRGGKG